MKKTDNPHDVSVRKISDRSLVRSRRKGARRPSKWSW